MVCLLGKFLSLFWGVYLCQLQRSARVLWAPRHSREALGAAMSMHLERECFCLRQCLQSQFGEAEVGLSGDFNVQRTAFDDSYVLFGEFHE